jgi:hypothetical protein
MGKVFSLVLPVVGFALIAFATSSRGIDLDLGRKAFLVVAGGIFTIALAVYIRD